MTDRSTYADGRALAEGVDHVIVNGTLVLEDGEPTGATPAAPCGGDDAGGDGRHGASVIVSVGRSPTSFTGSPSLMM